MSNVWKELKYKSPPAICEQYVTIDTEGNANTLEWYDGDCFASGGQGHWSNENGDEIKDITHWIEKP